MHHQCGDRLSGQRAADSCIHRDSHEHRTRGTRAQAEGRLRCGGHAPPGPEIAGQAVTTATSASTGAASELALDAPSGSHQRGWGRFWVSVVMMWSVERLPSLVRLVKPFFALMAWHTSRSLRMSLL